MRQVVNSYPGNPVLISEADEPNITELTKMYGAKNDEIQLPMDFQIAEVNKISVPVFGKKLEDVDSNANNNHTKFFLRNDNHHRHCHEDVAGAQHDHITNKMAANLLSKEDK